MKQYKRLRTYMQIATVSCVLLLILLGLFQSIWVLGGSASSIMVQCGLQRTRVQAIVKDVLILVYRQASEHPQAVSELQNILPRWEQTQNGLQTGSTTLQLPIHVPEDIAQDLASAQSDYISIDTALKVILAHADTTPDPLQITIVLAHEHGYSLTMTQVTTVWQQHIDSAFLHIFWIECGLVLSIIAVVVLIFVLVTRQALLKKETIL